LGIFAAASVAGYFVPILGMGLILAALSFFLRPEVPGMKLARPRHPVGMDLAEADPDAGPNPMS
jgi:hypothetical protein